MAHKHTNHLINETSPYLLQHAHNPVNWHPWGKQALDLAKQEDKMILVSIGYSACHWCHVMERESFENEDTAAIMNRHFINIKIDREERPDLDHIYMDAVQAISGSGGWPLNVFLTPDTKPFYGGTYFPPLRAFNRSSWREVLQNLVQSWKEKRNEIEAQAENLTDYISKAGNFSTIIKKDWDISFDKEEDNTVGENIFSAIMKSADKVWGGFGKAPKFPQTFTIQYLFEFYHYTRNETALTQALLSIDKMLNGGIYDHVGGGLARYSTDEQWLAPHFEKMLYDNALFISVLCDAFQITKDDKYKKAIDKTISFLKNEMLHPLGGFYAALDADSEGEEGKFYVWEKAEVEKILVEDTATFCNFFDITESGNWDGKNILRVLKEENDFIKGTGLNNSIFSKYIEDCLVKLLGERNKRIRPALDDKIILGWNALAVKAITKAAIVLGNNEYKHIAINAYSFLLENFSIEKGRYELAHTWKNGISKYSAFLDDYAYLIEASLAMYELTFDTIYLDKAYSLCQHVLINFTDQENLFFYYTNKSQEDIIVRKKEIYDGATPSGNAVMACNLHKLSILYDQTEWRNRSGAMLKAISQAIIKYPTSFAVWASLLLQKINGSVEIAIIGEQFYDYSKTILAENYLPGKLIMVSESGNENYPMLRNRKAENFVQIFVCRNYICHLPITTTEGFSNEIRKLLKQQKD